MVRGLVAVAALLGLLALPGEVRAEATELRVAKQFGIAYMQFFVMQDQKMVEKQAKAAGLGDVSVEWQPRPNRALLHDRHTNRTEVIVPFVHSGRTG